MTHAEEKKKRAAKEKKQENAMIGGTVVFSIVFALGLFFALPYFLSGIFHKVDCIGYRDCAAWRD